MLRIGLVAQPFDGVLPPSQNSVGLVLYQTARALSARADVTAIFRGDGVQPVPPELHFRAEAVGVGFDALLGDVAGKYPRWAKKLGLQSLADSGPCYSLAVRSALRRNACSVGHVFNFWHCCRALRGATRALVLEMHSEWLTQAPPRKVLQQLASVDAVVGVSDHVVNLFRDAFPNYAGLVATSYNAVDTHLFCPDPTADLAESPSAGPHVLFVGRLSPEKGIHVLLDAFEALLDRYPEATLELAGKPAVTPPRYLVEVSSDPLVRGLAVFYDGTISDDYPAYLKRKATTGALAGRVRFLGGLAHAALIERYRRATLVVNPSISESFGMSVIEAMACGRPVVGTTVGGMKETIRHGENGLLVTPGCADELAHAMNAIISAPATAAAMGLRAREIVKDDFSWQARAGRLMRVYRELLGEGNSSGKAGGHTSGVDKAP